VTNPEAPNENASHSIVKLPLAAAIIALIGLADAIYLTVHHYTAAPVPCGADFDCGSVLSSPYAEIGGIPLAAFGAAAYFSAFSLALLAAFGNRALWTLFGAQTILMATVSAWLIYIQYAVIHAWCQYCLVSAFTTFTLYLLFLASRFLKADNSDISTG
jgi:uncharacterized membrane protein